MANLVWDEDAIIEAMIRYRRTAGRWPKSRDWWFANKGKWPSFTTVCKTDLKWNGLLKIAKETERNAATEA
jgi:hypothetical protein